ncbi:MAG: hypothetical protein EA428_15415 [Spirochaetaceae bacterium]|nr:MAG: hypothetical protein EA428_15415 [Spirochaetaceae bacterium]
MIYLLLVVMLIGPGVLGFTESYTVTESVVLPTEYHVGDRAELRVRIRTASSVELLVPAALPEVSWLTFHDMRLFPIDAQQTEIRISFTAFRPGTQTLPTVDLGGIRLSGLTVHVTSVLEEGRTDPAPLEPPMILPTTRLRLAAFVALIIVGPLLLWMLLRLGRGQVSTLVARYRRAQPYRRLRKSLKRLESNLEELDARSFYIVLLEDVRRYFTQRLGRDLMSATSVEIIHYISGIDARGSDLIAEVFRTGDLVKFAGRPSTPEQRGKHLGGVSQVIAELESAPIGRGVARGQRGRGTGGRRGARGGSQRVGA